MQRTASRKRAGRRLSRAEPRIRRASTLAVVPSGRKLLLYNYLNATSIYLTRSRQEILLRLDRWTDRLPLLESLAGRRTSNLAEVRRMTSQGFILTEGSPAADTDRRYEWRWEWDIRAGLFHLAIKDPPILSEGDDLAELKERIRSKPAVSLHAGNANKGEVTTLRRPDLEKGLLGTLARRRSRRKFSSKIVPVRVLGDCLFAGLGITGFIQDPVEGMGPLPLKMTPSGGARNPYEAYVYVRRIAGLSPGLYHYSALEHSLGRIASRGVPPPSRFIGDQMWADDASALVFLVANFERSMWKYSHPMVYRAVLIEAGHIAQNIMVVAASHGLSTVPTALLNDSLFERLLELDRIMQAVVYVVALGPPATSDLDWGTLVPVGPVPRGSSSGM